MPRALIATANNELARFFELELETCGYASYTVSDLSALTQKYDLLILDIDTVSDIETEEYACCAVRVSSNITTLPDGGKLLSWPASITDIRRACAAEGSCSGEQTVKVEQVSTNTVYVVDKDSLTVSVGNRYVRLSRTEFVILQTLCGANGETVSRRRIMELLGADSGNISDVYVCHLRKKLEGDLGKRLIFTQRGEGYRTSLKMI